MARRIIIVESAQEPPPRLFARRGMRVAAWKAFAGTFLCLTLLFVALVVTVVQPQWMQPYLPLQAFAIESEQSFEEQAETMPARKVNVPSIPTVIPVKPSPQEVPILVMNVPEFPAVAKINETFLEEKDLHIPLDSEIKPKAQEKKKPQAKKDIAQNKKRDNPDLASMAGSADQKAQPKHTPFPPYPRDAKNAREEGTVILRISLNPQGKPTQVAIAQSSGFQSLDTAAQTWVKQNWSFHPAMAKDTAIACTLVQRLRFVLN